MTVWDVSGTDPLPGKEPVPLAPPAEPITGDSHHHLIAPLIAHAAELGYRVEIRELPEGGPGGWCDAKSKLIIVANGPGNQQVRTLTHELAHAHGVGYEQYTRAQAEVLVDCVTYCVLGSVGLDVGGESIPYGCKSSRVDACGLLCESVVWRGRPRAKSRIWGLVLPRCIVCAPRCGARAVLRPGCVPVRDHPRVAGLRLGDEVALAIVLAAGLPDRVGVVLALLRGGAGAQLELAQFAAVQRRAVVGVVLAAGEQVPAEHRDLAGDGDGRDLRAATCLDALSECAQRAGHALG